ncbi:MAG: hypothetical protein ACOWWH_11175 [Eubacteriaceae bacterium]
MNHCMQWQIDMEMFLIKSDEGYIRFLKDESFQITSMDKASVYPDKNECEKKLMIMKKKVKNETLRIAKIIISEEDYQ